MFGSRNTSSGRCIATASIYVSILIKIDKDKNVLSEHYPWLNIFHS